MKDKNLTRDMTLGSPFRHMLSFGIPVAVGNICQNLYNALDTAIVGRAVGTGALAAVGAAGSLWSLVMGCARVVDGFGIAVARSFGAKKDAVTRKYVVMSLYLTLIIAALVTALSLLLARPVLEFMGTPADIIDDSVLYISIIFAGMPFTMIYRLTTDILSAFGNSKIPLLATTVGSLFNIAVDLTLVVVFRLGVVGVAVGTVLANVVCIPLCLHYLMKISFMRFTKEDLRFDGKMAGELLWLGAPIGCMDIVTAIGMSILQAVVNSMGSAVVAAYVVAHKVIELSYQLTDVVAYSMSTFMSQNLGAGLVKRAKSGIRTAVLMNVVLSAAIAIVLVFLGKPITALFIGAGEREVISIAYPYVAIVGSMIWSLAMLFIFRAALQSTGNTFIPMFSGLVELIFRLAVVFILPRSWGFYRICFAEVSAWIFAALMLFVAFRLRIRKIEMKKAA